SVECAAWRRIAAGRYSGGPMGSADQSRAERPALRWAVGILELLGSRQVAPHGADYAGPENIRDAGAGLSRISRLCVRMLHDVRVRSRDLRAGDESARRTAGPDDCVVICPDGSLNSRMTATLEREIKLHFDAPDSA